MSSPWKDFPNSDTPPPRRIVCDAHTCFGKPRIEGTRLHLLLFVGMTREQVVEAWPDLNLTDEEWTAIQNWLASAAGRRAQQQETQAAPGFPNNKTERPFEGIPAGQEPEVMPACVITTSNMTLTMPLEGDYVLKVDPWPPLSREQVVELHEALVTFMRTMGPGTSTRTNAIAAMNLHYVLTTLNISTLPQPRRWTNGDIQAALEKHEEPTASLASSPLGVKPCPLCRGSGQARSVQQINPDGSYEPKDAPLVNCMVCEGTGQISPEDEVQEEVKRNCGTCRHYHQPSEMGCGVMETSRGARLWRMNAGALESDAQIRAWLEESGDGCPGWEPKP